MNAKIATAEKNKHWLFVPCTFIKDIASGTTGSCNAKFCLFTHRCEEPNDFDVLGLDIKAFDLSAFDEWCVDKDKTGQTETNNPTRYPSHIPMKETFVDKNTTTSSPQTIMPNNPQNRDTTSHACRIRSSPFGIDVFAITLIPIILSV